MAGMIPLAAPTARVTPNPARIALPGRKKKGRWVKQFGNIQFLIMAIGGVVFFTLLLVTGNTMAIAVRERTGELAVLKAVGYSDRFVLLFVMFESLLIAVIGGALGLGLAKLFTLGGDPTRGSTC